MSATTRRYPLYERLPEIHRTRDEEAGGGQLRAYVGLLEEVFGEIHRSIEELYHDLFVETAADWAVPYIGDLLGTTHLAGDPWTVRADVADTIALRRRKGTLAAVEQLVFILTRWGVRCVELREVLAWAQHLNHLRPDAGGDPPFALPGVTRHTVVRGGTAPVRDPALLSLLGGAFDPFMRLPDVRPPAGGATRPNLPNLAIYLWRLQSHRVKVTPPVYVPPAAPFTSATVARFLVHPMGDPVRLFNVSRTDADRLRGELTRMEQVPGPLLRALLTTGSPAGAPDLFVSVDPYDDTLPGAQGAEDSHHALQLHVPQSAFAGGSWTFRGANLLWWEAGLAAPLADREVAVDPENGRIAIGVANAAEVTALRDALRISWTYAAPGEVGGHPVSRDPAPAEIGGAAVTLLPITWDETVNRLEDALENLDPARPTVIEIRDDFVHDLDLGAVAGTVVEDGGPNLLLSHSLTIRAGSGFSPIIRLAQPLRFRPAQVSAPFNPDPVAMAAAQAALEARMDALTVRLEGLYVTRQPPGAVNPGFPAGEPLVARAALHALEVLDCTLDPGGFRRCDGSRAPVHPSFRLRVPFGFAAVADEVNFEQNPEIHVQRSITGPIRADTRYSLFVTDSVVDAGAAVDDAPATAGFAVSGSVPGDPVDALHGWGPPTVLSGVTFFGRVRVERMEGKGGIFVHRLQVRDDQHGCIKHSWFRGVNDRLPQHHACVRGTEARLAFTDEAFGDPAYGQLAMAADFRVRERGPGDDAMGAYGHLMEAHAWRNLQVRFREFMPVGTRPLLVPVT